MCCVNVAVESGGGCLCKRTLYQFRLQFLCLCVDSLGGHGRHGALPAVLSAGVCHTICVVSGCGCGLPSSSGAVSHSLSVVLCASCVFGSVSGHAVCEGLSPGVLWCLGVAEFRCVLPSADRCV